MPLITLEDYVKERYARGKSDSEIAKEFDIPETLVEFILRSCRIPIKITSVRIVEPPNTGMNPTPLTPRENESSGS